MSKKIKTNNVSELMYTTMENFRDRVERKTQSNGFKCKFHKLIKMIHGFKSGELHVIGGLSSMGKTSFALNLLIDFSIRENIPCVYFTMETKKNQISDHLVKIESSTDGSFWDVPNEVFTESESERIFLGIERLHNAKITIDDEPYLSIKSLRTKLKAYIKEADVKAVFIDSLQLMEAPEVSSKDGRLEQLSVLSRALKKLSIELDITIFVIAQMTKSINKPVNQRLTLLDMNSCGSLGQDADLVYLLHRPDYFDPYERPGETEIIIAKNRRGDTGIVNLAFIKNMMRFENIASV